MQKDNHCCILCGKDRKKGASFRMRCLGESAYCIDCEEKYYMRMAEECGIHIALYSACAAFNVPYLPTLISADEYQEFSEQDKKWSYYLDKLEKSGLNERDGKPKGFLDGITNILRVFGKDLTEADTAKYLRVEFSRLAAKNGTEAQREKWGEEDGYTDDEYNALDRMYNNRVQGFKGATISEQQEYVITEVCKWQLVADRLRRQNEIKGATDALKAVDALLASECMRKKDEKPLEAQRIDALVVALENAGLMENGQLLTYDETVEVLRDRFVKSKKYDYSLDVADQVVFACLNAIRSNADLALLTDLEDEYAVEDEYEECAEEETDAEREAKRYAGLTKVNIVKSEKRKEE